MEAEVILEAKNLTKRYSLRSHPWSSTQSWVEAVKDIHLTLKTGECVGLVGESGCGKSTLARLLCGLIPPTAGTVLYQGRPLSQLRGESLRQFRRSVQIIFQDSTASLNPLMRIGQIIAEPLRIHHLANGERLRQRVSSLLGEVGIDPSWVNRFPSTLSGGQRQRVGIARALALSPKILVCDEPVSSLDLSVQAQILGLLADLQARRGVGLLFISHNLSVVGALADRILVMRAGQVIEEGTNPDLFRDPKQPYTRLLVDLAFQRV